MISRIKRGSKQDGGFFAQKAFCILPVIGSWNWVTLKNDFIRKKNCNHKEIFTFYWINSMEQILVNKNLEGHVINHTEEIEIGGRHWHVNMDYQLDSE